MSYQVVDHKDGEGICLRGKNKGKRRKISITRHIKAYKPKPKTTGDNPTNIGDTSKTSSNVGKKGKGKQR